MCTRATLGVGTFSFVFNRILYYVVFYVICIIQQSKGLSDQKQRSRNLYHTLDELVDLLSSGAGLATLEEVEELGLGGEAAVGAGQLEGPEEVVGALEVGSDGVDLVDEVSDASDVGALEALLDDGVLGNGDALLVELAEAALVDELLDGVAGGVAVGDVGLDEAEHIENYVVKYPINLGRRPRHPRGSGGAWSWRRSRRWGWTA